MTISSRGNSWVVTIGSGDDRYRRSFKKHEDAVKAELEQISLRTEHIDARKRTQEARSNGRLGVSLGRTLKAAYNLALADTWSGNKSKSHTKTSAAILKALGEDTLVNTITPAVIREMVEEFEDIGNTGSTINKKLSALSMMLKAAADEEWIDSLPRIKRRKGGTNRLRWMDAEEELKAQAICEQYGLYALKDFIITAIDTGFRKTELLEFRVNQYHHGMLHLHPEETKTSKPRSIPATNRVDEVISRRLNNDRLFNDLTVSTLRDQWHFLRETMGMLDDPQFVVHMLRHTCASRMAMANKTAQFIQEWMGHATPLTTAKYMHLSPGKLLEGTEALDDYRRDYTPRLRVVG